MIATLLANPSLTQDDVAKAAGVCRNTVAKVYKQIKRASESSGIELEAYKMLLRERVPVDKRVNTLRTAIDKADTNPFAALKAVEYADNMLGLSPKQQDTQQLAESRPMFMLPAGTKISVNLVTPDDAVDITPSDTDTGYKNDL
jgi:hypothetical protein